MSSALTKTVMSNVTVFIAGKVSRSDAKQTAEMMGIDPQDLADMTTGQFYIAAGTKPPIKVQSRTDLLGYSNTVFESTWPLIIKQQVERYYRRIEERSEERGEEVWEEKEDDIKTFDAEQKQEPASQPQPKRAKKRAPKSGINFDQGFDDSEI
jgi:hypothetical protein